jgi:hypothetical protein
MVIRDPKLLKQIAQQKGLTYTEYVRLKALARAVRATSIRINSKLEPTRSV